MTEIDFFDILQGQAAAFLLVLTRISGIFLIAPFFGTINIPVQMRAATAIMMSLVIFPVVVRNAVVTAPETIFMFAGTVVQELFVGWLIGFVAFIALSTMNMAGKIMDMQVGFSMANVFDPTSGQQTSLIGIFLYNLAVIYLLVSNGHHMIIAAVVESFNRVPLDGLVWKESMADFVINLTSSIFLVGMKIAIPVTFTILMINVGMGILARTMPQMNIFVVGIPLHLVSGLFMLAMLLPFYILFLDVIFGDMYANISTALRYISP